jgi:uncharacterized protein
MASTDPAIETPCTQVCVVHPASGLCIGCGRSIDEIARWIDYDAAERARIMAQLPSRLAAMKSAKTAAKSSAKTGAQPAPATP